MAAERVPVLVMLELGADVLAARTRQLAQLTGGRVVDMPSPAGAAAAVARARWPRRRSGPGSAGAGALAARLRAGDPALIARVQDDLVLLSARTLAAEEIVLAAECVGRARGC